jgi:hypothetical protein
MSGLLKSIGLEFNQLIVLILVLVISVIAVRLTVTFDINKYQEERKKNNLTKLRNACTHHRVIKEGKQYGLQSLFISPPGTLQWQCQQCGTIRFFADGESEQMTKYYLKIFKDLT